MIRKVNLHIILLLAVGLAFFLIKCHIIYPIKFVGHADAASYAEMADSLIHGRGFEVDYISWYFVKYDPKIVRPEDHWPPLYSIAIAPFFAILGKSAFAAKLPSLIIACFLLPLVIYSLAKELSGSKYVGLAAGFHVLLYPAIFGASLRCLSDVIYVFVFCAAVLFSAKSLDDENSFYYAGVFLGLAYYAKGSGLLLIPAYVLFHIIARFSVRKVVTNRKFLLSLLIAFLVLLPWFIRNYVHFGDPLFTTQRFSAGYGGYKGWEEGTYELYWGEKPPPTYPDKLKKTSLFSIGLEFSDDLDEGAISEALRGELKNNSLSLSKDAALSVKKTGDKWVIADKDQTYTFRKESDELRIYRGGIDHAVRMTKNYLKRYLWWSFADINSRGWGKFGDKKFAKSQWKGPGRNAFLTYFTNTPALLGLLLLWGNRKRHIIWLASGALILFLSVCWFPIDRMALPIIPLMMALGWATYFMILKSALKALKWLRKKCGQDVRAPRVRLGSGNLEQRRQEAMSQVKRLISSAKGRFSLDMVAGLVICCLAVPVVVLSAESVQTAIRKSGYPYRESQQSRMDIGRWLKENAPPDAITMTRNPWELHFYSEQFAIQIPRTTLEKTIEVMRYYRPSYIIPLLDRRPSLKPLVEGEVPGLELVYDNNKLQLYKIDYELLPEAESGGPD